MSDGVLFSRLLEGFFHGPVFKDVGERSITKNYCHVSLLSVISKVFEKLINNTILDHIEICDLFSDFQYGFRSSQSTTDLLTVVSDGIARAFNKSGATQALALDIQGYGISGQIFGLLFHLFSVIDSLEWFWIASLYRNIQLMPEFLKAPFLVLYLSYYTLITFLMMLYVILVSILMILPCILNVIRHLICGSNLNWLLIFNLIYETL